MWKAQDDDLDKNALMQQLGGADTGEASMSQSPEGFWQLNEHGNTRQLQGQEVDDARKYVSDLAAQRQPAPDAAPEVAAVGAPMPQGDTPAAPTKQMPGNPLAALGSALKPSAVLNPLSAQNPLSPKNVGNLLNPMSATNPLAPKNVAHQLDPRTVHQNLKNVLNPRNILHPKEAFRRIFGGG